VLIPEENVRDLAEIPDNIKNKLEIIPVRWIDQVLEHALERKPEPRSGRGAGGSARRRGHQRRERCRVDRHHPLSGSAGRPRLLRCGGGRG
jgi:predicted ATP-dependent protease